MSVDPITFEIVRHRLFRVVEEAVITLKHVSGSAITNDSFLALVSDQGLRTIIITGRPELGAPDWRGNVPGKPMSDQEITDVVAWIATHRVQTPGQPYSASNYAQQQE